MVCPRNEPVYWVCKTETLFCDTSRGTISGSCESKNDLANFVLSRRNLSRKRTKNEPFERLARLRQSPAAFLLNRAITRGASGLTFCTQPCQSYMQSFIKIGGAVLEKNANRTMTLCNFNKDSECLKWQNCQFQKV